MCCQALKDAEFLAWGRIKHIHVENPSSCHSPACSGCSWPSPSLVGMLPNVGARVQGERTAHRCVELHRDLGRKGGLGKSKRLRISIWVINIWISPKLISALFCSLFQLCFLTFSTGSCVAQKVTQDQSDIISQVGQSVIFNCQYGIGWFTYYYSIYWYKQLPRGQMTLLIHQNSEHGNAGYGRYSVNFQKAYKSISLTISALQLEDSAKYVCALRELSSKRTVTKEVHSA